MVSHQRDHLAVVVNAACKDADEAHLRASLGDTCEVTMLRDRALVALQGPRAEEALTRLAPEVSTMRFMDALPIDIMGATCLVSRSGYTGEDGFEIGIPAGHAEALCEALLRDDAVAMAGLGARDTLRLEAGLCLYGSDLDMETTPVEAALEWTIAPARRVGGARAGGFPGAKRILDELANGAARRRVGLKPQGRAPVRAHAPLFCDEAPGAAIGAVTSGGFGPSLDAPIALGYVSTSCAQTGTRLFAEVRGKRLPVAVTELPFVTPHYKRR
jgi:aminomethyltransferase